MRASALVEDRLERVSEVGASARVAPGGEVAGPDRSTIPARDLDRAVDVATVEVLVLVTGGAHDQRHRPDGTVWFPAAVPCQALHSVESNCLGSGHD